MHNLPAEVTSFVGRERELADIRQVLDRARLLTLTGVGGGGKTHLALQAARQLAPRFTQGVFLVRLAPLMDAVQVPRAVALALGVRGRSGQPVIDAVAGAIADRDLLLLLDNCEHVIAATAQLVDALLSECPALRILATSREPLRVAGEAVMRVPPLCLPLQGSAMTAEALAEVDSIKLFVDRARARQSAFKLTAETAAGVARICCKLDGVPLAIELAAAQTGRLSLGEIGVQLDDSMRLLVGGRRTVGRQETLRATLDWSHALLSDPERVVFRRVAAFTGSFDLQAAQQVCADQAHSDELRQSLVDLVDKSLVEAQTEGPATRFRVLEPVRQYAWEQLVENREAAELQRRHAEYFATLAERVESALMSPNRGEALACLLLERDNLRAALTWSQHCHDPEATALGMRLAAALFWFWVFRGEASEGIEWLEPMVTHEPPTDPALRARVLHAAGELAWLLGLTAQARTRLEESARLYTSVGDDRGLAYDLQALAMLLEGPAAEDAAQESLRLFERAGDSWGAAHAASSLWLQRTVGDEPREAFEQALAPWVALGDEWGIAQFRNFLGDYERSQGNLAAARAQYEEALQRLRGIGLTGTVPSLLHNLAYVAQGTGDTAGALRLFRESLMLFRNQGDERGIADCLDGAAAVFADLRQPMRAARLLGAAEALRGRTGAHVWAANARDLANTYRKLAELTDQRALAQERAHGRELSLAEAVEAALAADAEGGESQGELTPRELEVAMLIAAGLSNRRIGTQLVISEGTARLHVKHILRKLGFTSRAQIAGWAVARGIVAPGTENIPPLN